MAAVETLLGRLQHVRATGPDSWRADCPNPVHEHGRGMLAIRCGGDGVLLLHCFGCGNVAGILAAIGLTVADLFPTKPKDLSPEGRRAAHSEFRHSAWSAALNVLGRESTCVLVAAGMLAHDEPLTADDHDRLALAMQRIDDARQVLT